MTDRAKHWNWDLSETTFVPDTDENWDEDEERTTGSVLDSIAAGRPLEKVFDEALHPRDAHGRFGEGGAVEQPFETMPKPRPAPELKDWGNPKGPMNKDGGSYRRVRQSAQPGQEIHHMPADGATYSLHTNNGPCINMSAEDHFLTASYGTSKSAQMYRDEQRQLVSQGKFLEAQQMDIDDIHEKFGSKYDKQIEEMKNYTSSLKFNKRSGIPMNPTPKVIRAGKA